MATLVRTMPASRSCRRVATVAAAFASASTLLLLPTLPPTTRPPRIRVANPPPSLLRLHNEDGGRLSSPNTVGRGSYANSNGTLRLQQLLALPSSQQVGGNGGGAVYVIRERNVSTKLLTDAPAAQQAVAPSCRGGDRRKCVAGATPAAENSRDHPYENWRSAPAEREGRTYAFSLSSGASEGAAVSEAAGTVPAVTATTSHGGQASKAANAVMVVTAAAATNVSSSMADNEPTVYIGFEKTGGRLGNRMFQYASGLALALRYGLRAVLVLPHAPAVSLMGDMRRIFRLSPLPTLLARPPPSAAVQLVESGWGLYDAARFDNASTFERSVYTVGFLQSWKYFMPVAERVRREFALAADAERAAASYFRSVGLPLPSEDGGGGSGDDGGRVDEARPVRVGVHVRRAGMVHMNQSYTVAPAEYLLKAIAHYSDKYAAPRYNVSFIFATDDRAWVHDLVASRLPPELIVRFVSLDAGGDMAVLSRCDHSIITGGTFGWWSAWLAGGDVVYYRDFIQPTSRLYVNYSPDDYYPPAWLGVAA